MLLLGVPGRCRIIRDFQDTVYPFFESDTLFLEWFVGFAFSCSAIRRIEGCPNSTFPATVIIIGISQVNSEYTTVLIAVGKNIGDCPKNRPQPLYLSLSLCICICYVYTYIYIYIYIYNRHLGLINAPPLICCFPPNDLFHYSFTIKKGIY